MRMRRIVYMNLWVLIFSMMALSCVERTPLPTEIYIPQNFAAGDTSYLLQRPIWDETWGFETPLEISIALDGHIFVADSAAERIFVLGQDGEILEGFDVLSDLMTDTAQPLTPIDVDIDSRMNVYFIDGSNTIYRWNQYYNDVGIAAVSSAATFVNTQTDETQYLTQGSLEWLQIANHQDWEILDIEWSTDPALMDMYTKPSVFFDAASELNQYLDTYYNGENSRFRAMSATEGNERYIYAADAPTEEDKDRIIRIDLARAHYLKLESQEFSEYNSATQYQTGSVVNFEYQGIVFTFKWQAEQPATGFSPMDQDGMIDHIHWELDDVLWAHQGIFGRTVTGFGMGVGSVNQPTGLDVDYTGAIYYSQNSEYFSANAILRHSDGRYLSIFDVATHEIMEISRFSNPHDIAVDSDQNIYIVNSGSNEVEVFNSDGKAYKNAGVGVLKKPVAVAVDSRGLIYVCDEQTSSIVRYRLSNVVDENIVPIDN